MEALHSETYSLSTHEAAVGICKPKEWRKSGLVVIIVIVLLLLLEIVIVFQLYLLIFLRELKSFSPFFGI